MMFRLYGLNGPSEGGRGRSRGERGWSIGVFLSIAARLVYVPGFEPILSERPSSVRVSPGNAGASPRRIVGFESMNKTS